MVKAWIFREDAVKSVDKVLSHWQSSGQLVKTLNFSNHSQRFFIQEFAFLTSYQVIPTLLVQMPQSESHCTRGRYILIQRIRKCVKPFLEGRTAILISQFKV